MPANLEGLLEIDSEAIPVRITIVQDDVTTGWDDGALGFEGDAVWFSGRATSFRLMAPDIVPGAYLLSRREAVTSGEALNQGFPLRHPTREVWVRVKVLTGEKEGKALDEARLVEGIQRLRALSEGDGASEYPPLAPRPRTISPSWLGLSPGLRYGLNLSGMGLIAISQLLSITIHSSPSSTLALILSGVALMVVKPPRPDEKRLCRIAVEEETA